MVWRRTILLLEWSMKIGNLAKAEQKVRILWRVATTDLELHMQKKQALSRREEVVWVAGTVAVAVVNLLGAGKSEAVLSSGGVRASRKAPRVLQRTRTIPKARQIGKCEQSLEGMGFPFLCLNCRTQQHISGLYVLQLCCGLSGWDTVVRQLLSSYLLVFLGRTPACTGRRHLKHALTGTEMQIWMCGTVAMGHTANAATLESRSSLSIYTQFLMYTSVKSRAALVRKQGKVQSSCKGLVGVPSLVRISAQQLSSLADPCPGCKTGESNRVSASWTKCLAERKWFPKSKCLLDTDSKPSSCQLLIQKRVELEIKFSPSCCFHTL